MTEAHVISILLVSLCVGAVASVMVVSQSNASVEKAAIDAGLSQQVVYKAGFSPQIIWVKSPAPSAVEIEE